MSASAKYNIDRSQVFAVYNVYRLVIGSVLFALTISSTESVLVSDETSMQVVAAGILIVTSLIIATLGPGSKLRLKAAFSCHDDRCRRYHLDSDRHGSGHRVYGSLLCDCRCRQHPATKQTVINIGCCTYRYGDPRDTVFHLSRGDTDSSELLYAGLRGALLFVVCWLGRSPRRRWYKLSASCMATTQARRLKLTRLLNICRPVF